MDRNLKKGLIVIASLGAGMLCSLALKKEEERHPVTERHIKEDAYTTACTPGQRKRQLAQDLKRYGTKQGVIDVADCQGRKKPSQIEKAGANMLAAFQNRRSQKKNAFNLGDDIRTTQLTLTNTTEQQQEITLWGQRDNPALEGSPVQATIPTGVHPQDVVFNPANGLTYVANQLSDSVSILSGLGKLITTITLGDAYPGLVSPVALAVHDNPASPDYGKVYVAGSVSDTISVIGTDNELTIALDAQRPVAVAFNTVNNNLYVACFVSRRVVVIDGGTHQEVASLESVEPPIGLAVNPGNGDVFITYSGSTRVGVYNKSHSRIATVDGIPENASHLAFDAGSGCLWIASNSSATLVSIDAATYEIRSETDAGNNILAMAFNPVNEKLSVTDGASLKTLQADGSFTLDLGLEAVNALAFDRSGALLTASQDSGSATVTVNKAPVAIDEDYAEKNRHFRHAPAVIEQARFFIAQHQRIPFMTARERSVSGKEVVATFSLEKYRSTGHFQNIITVPMKGFNLNGHSSWQFLLQAGQTVTILVSYRQLDSYALIPMETG